MIAPDLRLFGIVGVAGEEQAALEALIMDALVGHSGDLPKLAEQIRIAVRRRLRLLTGKNPIVDVRLTRSG